MTVGKKTITIWWEGHSFDVATDGNGYIDFVGLCDQLGLNGRDALLSVLWINHTNEVSEMGKLLARNVGR